MISKAETELFEADPTLPGVADPYPVFHRVRAADPVHWVPAMRGWAITRYADAHAVLRNPGAFSRQAYIESLRQRFGNEPILDLQAIELAFLDAPVHTRTRTLIGNAFTPQAVANMRPQVQRIVDGMLDRVAPQGEMDVIADFGHPLPSIVIAEMMGVPEADRERLADWVRGIVVSRSVMRNPEVIEEGSRSTRAFGDYFGVMLEQRRAEPGPDLISAFIAAEDNGDRLETAQLLSIITTLFAAGHETTKNVIGNGLLALLRNPDQLAMLCARPQLIESAIEEILRFDAPTQATSPQVAIRELEIGGRKISPGDSVTILIGACNRDPARFPQPDRFDITRTDHQHLAFSFGMHYCLGAGLARQEAQVALGTLVRRFPRMALPDQRLEWKTMGRFRGLKALRVTF